jgi:hypothetical protein
MTAPAPKSWILGIAPYVPGRATSEDGRKVVKLSSNENPFGTPAPPPIIWNAIPMLPRSTCAPRSPRITGSRRNG